MIKADEAAAKVAALRDEAALAECETIGRAVDEAAKRGETGLTVYIDIKIYKRVCAILSEHGYSIRNTSDDFHFEDDGVSINVSWPLKD